MTRRWFNPFHIPVTIGAVLLLVPWFYLGWNTTVGELIPQLRFRTKNTIAGLVDDAAPSLTWHAVRTGAFQRTLSREIGILSPLFKPAIHWKNQIYYTLLGTSGNERVVIGRHRELLEIAYLNEYCARDLATFRPKAEAWVGQLRAMQDFFEAKGKAFLYVITPSKVAQNPQYLPSGYKCPGNAEDRGRKLEIYDAMLRQHGIRYVDGASPLAAARQKYGIDMFPRGGVHWNSLAAALATQDVVEAANEQHSSPPLTQFTFTWQVSYWPTAIDRDLLDIMNLPHPDAHYPVPVLHYDSQRPPGECRPVKITEVGGSFLMGINTTLEALDCPPDISYWFYFDHKRFRYVDRHMRELPMDTAARRRALLDAEVVLFEENEAALPTSVHGEDFIRELKEMGAGF